MRSGGVGADGAARDSLYSNWSRMSHVGMRQECCIILHCYLGGVLYVFLLVCYMYYAYKHSCMHACIHAAARRGDSRQDAH